MLRAGPLLRRLLYRRDNFSGPVDELICTALRTELDAEIALSPGFRWGITALPAQPLTMEDVLTEVSEQAQASARIVTKLQLDQRMITDRDLDPAFLAESVVRFRQLTAVS